MPERIVPDDPRELGGSIAGPGGPHDQGQVVIDASRALIPDYTEVAMVDDSSGPVAAVQISGRINRTEDRATVLLVANPDALAAWVSQIVALAGRAEGSTLRQHRKFARQFRVDLAHRMNQIGEEGTGG